eukprot:TRINITY_DN2711_c0_g1_i5.p1 TRINITY_DN2711_c0_g1~~TRINITY_DN2711_c0_g1_i5.p1  ORF type:complete len:292 (+),score=56.10 TRINITY_DN2711_c0_g1_i5:46-921(+)
MEQGEVGEIEEEEEEGEEGAYYRPYGREHRGSLTLEHNIMFREMIEEHPGIYKHVIQGEKASPQFVKSIYDDFTLQFNERSGVRLTSTQVRKKIEHLKRRAKKEGTSLNDVSMKGDSFMEDSLNQSHIPHAPPTSRLPKTSPVALPVRGSVDYAGGFKKRRKGAQSSYSSSSKNGNSRNFTESSDVSNDTSDPSYLSCEIAEEQLSEVRLQTEATEIRLWSEKLRYERECLELEITKIEHALARDDYHKKFGKYPSFEDGTGEVKVEMLDDLEANNEDQEYEDEEGLITFK